MEHTVGTVIIYLQNVPNCTASLVNIHISATVYLLFSHCLPHSESLKV